MFKMLKCRCLSVLHHYHNTMIKKEIKMQEKHIDNKDVFKQHCDRAMYHIQECCEIQRKLDILTDELLQKAENIIDKIERL